MAILLRTLLGVLGRLLAVLPDRALRAIAVLLGSLVWILPHRRRRIQQANLRLAFPERSEAWYRTMGRENFCRLIEYGIFILASPALTEAQLRGRIQLGPHIEKLAAQLAGQRVVIFVPHVTHLEALPFLPCLLPGHPIAAVFRPLRNPIVSEVILSPRGRWGMQLIGRRGGLLQAAHVVSRGGWLGVPADQNTGATGTLVLFFDRPCSATPMPENFLHQHGGTFVGLIVRRTGFMRVEVDAEIIPASDAPGALTIAGHEWLERTLRRDDEMIVDWFWSHRRWRVLHEPRTCFRLAHKRNAVPLQLQLRGASAWPRRTRVVVIPPADPAAWPSAQALLVRLRESRPDFELSLWAPPGCPAPQPDAVDRTLAVAASGLSRSQRRAEADRVPEYVIALDPHPRWRRAVRSLHATHVFAPAVVGGKPHPYATQVAPSADLAAFFSHFGLPETR